jgi:predicted nucleic acid-binding protein
MSASPACVAASAGKWILSFDLARALRRLKPAKFSAPLVRRSAEELPFVYSLLHPGPELLLDTTVYIDGLQGRTPHQVGALMALRICNHSSVCVSELTHAFGRLALSHPETANTLARIAETISAMPPHRVSEPTQSSWGTAGMLAGLAFRLGGYQPGQEGKLLNDALIFLQALESGQAVLTGNIRDFDLLNQLLPEGRIILYRREDGSWPH